MTFRREGRASGRRVAAETAEKEKEKASHDTLNPPKLVEFMLTEWRKAPRRPPARVDRAQALLARRRKLSSRYPADTLVIPTGEEKLRANDTHYRFRPDSDFFYLTGNPEPDCVLVLEPRPRGGHRHVLYVEPNPGRSDATFFTNRKKGELWVGPRLGVQESQARYCVDETRSLEDLGKHLAKLARRKRTLRYLHGVSDVVDGALPELDVRNKELETYLSEMRLIKDNWEVSELSAAIASTLRGFEDIIARLPSARSEREIEGVFNLRARVEGNDVGYGTIAAAGAHACVLHWTRNDGVVRPGQLLLVDAGIERDSLYTADITRALPVSGRFTEEQREIYSLVLAAQEAGMGSVRPGVDFLAPNRVAQRVLAEGLERLGILRTSAKESLRKDNLFHKRYAMHNVSHMLGLDVHDCAHAREKRYKHGKLRAGMVLTMEPGLYFQLDDLTVPRKYRGIGVRIEDDVLVTRTGHRNLSKAIPKSPDDVEAWMARVWKTCNRA